MTEGANMRTIAEDQRRLVASHIVYLQHILAENAVSDDTQRPWVWRGPTPLPWAIVCRWPAYEAWFRVLSTSCRQFHRHCPVVIALGAGFEHTNPDESAIA